MLRAPALSSLALVVAIASAPAAQATVLTFDIDDNPSGVGASNNPLTTIHAAYGDNVSSTSVVNGAYIYNYGIGNGFTPDVTVAYGINGSAGNHIYYNDGDGPAGNPPAWRNVDFLPGGPAPAGPFPPYPAPGTSRSFTWTFTPTGGDGIVINSFDLFRYLGPDNHRVHWRIFGSTLGGTLLASGDTGVFNTTITAPLTVSPVMATYYGTVVFELSHLLGSGGGFALDNLNFDQVGPVVPEPATWSLLGLGAVGLVWNAKRRRRPPQSAGTR